MSSLYTSPTDRGPKTRWDQARGSAFVQDVLAACTQRPANLLPFEEVRHKLQLRNMSERGLQDVPLDYIVGSVGRYQDFNRAFFPRQDSLKDRWQRIDRLVAGGSGMPPIELYKVGGMYFVRDGNHRVSVARKHHFPTIQAYVWEYQTDIALEPNTDIDALLCQTAHAAFLERTHIHRLCPDLDIRLTQPDAYADLLNGIQTYQTILSQIDERDIPFDEAVVLWAEMRYTPVVEIIRQRDILRDFPGRTETDLYLWLCRNQEELAAHYGDQVLMEEAAEDLAGRFSQTRLSSRPVRQALRRLTAVTLSRSTTAFRALRRVLGRHQDTGHS
jgi:hypothetical protein